MLVNSRGGNKGGARRRGDKPYAVCRRILASGSSELRSRPGPTANIMGAADETALMKDWQPRQVALTTMSKLSLMVVLWRVMPI